MPEWEGTRPHRIAGMEGMHHVIGGRTVRVHLLLDSLFAGTHFQELQTAEASERSELKGA